MKQLIVTLCVFHLWHIYGIKHVFSLEGQQTSFLTLVVVFVFFINTDNVLHLSKTYLCFPSIFFLGRKKPR